MSLARVFLKAKTNLEQTSVNNFTGVLRRLLSQILTLCHLCFKEAPRLKHLEFYFIANYLIVAKCIS